MAKIAYVELAFRPGTLQIIVQANRIIDEYLDQGYKLTLRQLYYQFVSKDLLPNTQQSYSRLGSIVNDGRMTGLIDWESIEDRTRNLHKLATWGSPQDILSACASQYRTDKWATQPVRVEVWIEKEALAGVFERVCDRLTVPLFACRGYTSQSEMWRAAQRLKEHEESGQRTVILHFGDHDPSGMDMTRDIKERLALFGSQVTVRRMALSMDQVRQYKPPPNPAKMTDSRFKSYLEEYGDKSWELDALDPRVLSRLVERGVGMAGLDSDKWEAAREAELKDKDMLIAASDSWENICSFRSYWDERGNSEEKD